MLFLALGWAILFDLLTGVFAYYKQNGLIKQEYLIKSKLLKKTLEKGSGYLLVILMMAIFETHVFKIQFDQIDAIIGKPMYGTAILTTICILIEYWSILENLKKAGIDLLGRAVGAYRFVQKYIKLFKNENKSNGNKSN